MFSLVLHNYACIFNLLISNIIMSHDRGYGITMTMTSAAMLGTVMLLLCHMTQVHVVSPICCLVARLLDQGYIAGCLFTPNNLSLYKRLLFKHNLN